MNFFFEIFYKNLSKCHKFSRLGLSSYGPYYISDQNTIAAREGQSRRDVCLAAHSSYLGKKNNSTLFIPQTNCVSFQLGLNLSNVV